MEVKIRLDPRLVWQVEEEAEKSGMTFAEFVGGFLETSLRSGPVLAQIRRKPTTREETRRRVLLFHELGLSDEQIAVRVDRVTEYVSKLRRSAGLKANKVKEMV